MSDWQTISRDLAEETDRLQETELVGKALVRSLQFHRKFHMNFNEADLSITTVAEDRDYTLPTDFIFLVGKFLYYQRAGETIRVPIERRPWDWMQTFRDYGILSEEQLISNGEPRMFSLLNNIVEVTPTPSTSGDSIVGRYVKDLGTPTAEFTADYGWRILYNALPVSPTFTTAWLSTGYDAIKMYAKYLMYKRYLEDPAKADEALGEWQQAFNDLSIVTAMKRAPGGTRGHIMLY